MRISALLPFVSGLLLAGCASQNAGNFSGVPGPSAGVGGAPAAMTTPAEEPLPQSQSAPVPAPAPAPEQTAPQPPIVAPASSPEGTVMAFNAVGQFVVLSFPPGQLPSIGQMFSVYHNGLKVGEVKISGPQSENNIVADVIEGHAAVGDKARMQ
ncbi:MAG: hypothetical protein KGR98_00565 [Verrucomicrobia bacterium]|nr:hypothetical protein [Verrucomicrobiota bacterium]MDE3098887.1 hypothetical protein [Verrucomicrobiota bacterium]